MIPISVHGHELHSVFDLLGQDENDITYSIGWALSRCPAFTKGLVRHVLPSGDETGSIAINLQRHDKDGGFTDMEIRSERLHVIIEAKKGWTLPTATQLEQYRPRFATATRNLLVAMSECSQEYATPLLPSDVRGITVRHVQWKEVHRIASAAVAHETAAGKRLLNELLVYLEGVMTMQNQESNWVYVVSLSRDTIDHTKLEWADIPGLKSKYFHPFGSGNGWPKEPPNYLGFRFDGKLQGIHHVEGYVVTTQLYKHFPEFPKEEWAPHIVYDLGPRILPPHDVRTGNLFRAQRVWAMLDLLLTCKTIFEARDKSQERQRREDA